MKLGFFLIILALVFAETRSVHAQDDAPTGTYRGTWIVERTLEVVGAPATKPIKTKQISRVAGVATVPPGNARTFLKVILPSQNTFTLGTGVALTINFQQFPATVLIDGQQPGVVPPIPNVVGKMITLVFAGVVNSEGGTTLTTVRTLKISRTGP